VIRRISGLVPRSDAVIKALIESRAQPFAQRWIDIDGGAIHQLRPLSSPDEPRHSPDPFAPLSEPKKHSPAATFHGPRARPLSRAQSLPMQGSCSPWLSAWRRALPATQQATDGDDKQVDQFRALGAIHAGINQLDEVFVPTQGGMLFLHPYSFPKITRGHFGAVF
jgi:hypothetical protein